MAINKQSVVIVQVMRQVKASGMTCQHDDR